jgi:4-oxalomesaconate hydratase
MIDQNVNLLVVSAHAADFVWRAGGTIAKYVKYGANVALVILSYGVRGESNDLWNVEGQTTDNVKKSGGVRLRPREYILASKTWRSGITTIILWNLSRNAWTEWFARSDK